MLSIICSFYQDYVKNNGYFLNLNEMSKNRVFCDNLEKQDDINSRFVPLFASRKKKFKLRIS